MPESATETAKPVLYTLAKVVFILATAVTAFLVVATIFTSLFHYDHAALGFGWAGVAAVIFLIPIAGASLLVMAITGKVGSPKSVETGAVSEWDIEGGAKSVEKRTIYEWGILAFLFYLAIDLIGARYAPVWRGITVGWVVNPIWDLLPFGVGILSLISGIALALRQRWALHVLLALVFTLFASGSWEVYWGPRGTHLIGFLLYAGGRYFFFMIAFASYIYLRKGNFIPSHHSTETR